MNINLKLEIYRISLKKRGGSSKAEALLNYSEFFNDAFVEIEKEESYREFIKCYIESFKNEFILNRDKTKGLSAGKDHNFVPRSVLNIIDGDVIGGNTGIQKNIFSQENANETKGAIDKEDVSTLPYFLKIWTPARSKPVSI